MANPDFTHIFIRNEHRPLIDELAGLYAWEQGGHVPLARAVVVACQKEVNRLTIKKRKAAEFEKSKAEHLIDDIEFLDAALKEFSDDGQ